MAHFPITQAGVMALVAQIVAFIAGFGIINSAKEGAVIAAATAVVSAAFLVANSLHHIAEKPTVAQLAVPVDVVTPVPLVTPPAPPAPPA